MKKIYFLFCTILPGLISNANNIQISNVTVLPNSNQVQFDISWDNSWRSDILQNWDAAWVFMKYKDIDGKWKHLQFTNSNNTIPAGFSANIPADNNGAFLYRSAAGSGTASITGVKLGILSQFALGVYDIKIYGIEMVYIPTAYFWLGDFAASTNSYKTSASSLLPYLNRHPNRVGPFDLYDPIGVPSPILQGNTFSSGFAFGVDSFYCMKYEISQGAYRDFLNSLTLGQQTNRTANAPGSPVGTNALDNSGVGRSYIEIATPGISAPAVYGCDANNNNIFNEPGDGEWVTCNYLSWPDMAAYLSWACLAPMTELQYEKICRGPQQPVSGEYVWGTTQVSANIYVLTNAGFTNESISNPSPNPNEGNASYVTTNPVPTLNAAVPLRTGIFATATSNRISSGGSFYGVMDMSGSMWERVITTASQNGRDFLGNHGKGNVDQGGNATDVCNWPASNLTGSCEIDGSRNALGLMYRGGSSNWPASNMRVSDRSILETGPANIRYIDQGCRGVRNL